MFTWGDFACRGVSADYDPTRDYLRKLATGQSVLGSPISRLVFDGAGALPVPLLPAELRTARESAVETLLLNGNIDRPAEHLAGGPRLGARRRGRDRAARPDGEARPRPRRVLSGGGGEVIDLREALTSGLESLRHHALRSFLAMLGIIFGVGAVIAMLSTRDAQAIRDAVPGVERVVAKIEVEAWKVLSPAGRAKPRVLGVSSDYPALVRLALHEGRFFDRTDEDTHAAVCVIGDQVRRAMGARQVDIRNQFVMEAFAVTVTGGLLGIAMGLAIAKGVAAYAGWKTIVTFWSIALSVGVSAAVGLVFGSYPAMRAARLDPVEALRYE